MINNIINNIINKNVKQYFKIFLILLLILFFLYLTNYSSNYYRKKENFEKNNTSQKNTISKNINNIEVPSDFLPTHPWTKAKSGLNILDNPHEHYLYEENNKHEKNNKDAGQFTRTFTCRPSITGVFTDCGPYSFNACGPIKPSTSYYDKLKDKKYRKYRKYRNDRNDRSSDEEISIFCDKNICHHVYHHKKKQINDNDENNKNKNKNSKNQNTKNQAQLDYDEYMNDLDGY